MLSSQASSEVLRAALSPLPPLPPDIENDPIAWTVDQLREWRGLLVQGQNQLLLIYDMVSKKHVARVERPRSKNVYSLLKDPG